MVFLNDFFSLFDQKIILKSVLTLFFIKNVTLISLVVLDKLVGS